MTLMKVAYLLVVLGGVNLVFEGLTGAGFFHDMLGEGMLERALDAAIGISGLYVGYKALSGKKK